MVYNFLSFDEILAFGIDVQYLKTAINRYRKGETTKWVNIKDPKDGRKVLINIDTIPERTRKKHNIPTGLEYLKQKQEQETKLLANKIAFERELKNNADKKALYDAFHGGWFEFLPIYQERFAYNPKLAETAMQKAKEHAFWLKMVYVTGDKWKAHKKGGLMHGFKLYSELKDELNFKNQLSSEAAFRNKMSQIRCAYQKYDDITEALSIGFYKPKTEQKKTNDFHRALAMAFLSQPNKYSYRVVTDLVNHHLQEADQPEITESWIKTLMASDNQFKTQVLNQRNGLKWANDNLLASAVRKSTPYPADCWMLDGTPMQFFCWNESRTKSVRLNLFVIIDVCTRKIVGFDISYSEDKYNIMNALKNAVMMEGHLPTEIVSDNFSASKSEEIISLKEEMERMGTMWRHAKVGNPQDKAYVERFFGAFQSVECALYDDYIGEGITSKRNNRPNAEYLAKVAKEKGLPTYKEMVDRIIKMVLKYNERSKANMKAPLELYKNLPKPNAKELDSVKTALLFWKRTKVTVQRGTVKFKVKGNIQQYEIYEHKYKTALQGKQVYVRYDERDLDTVMLFDKRTETVICECKKALEINTAQVNRTEADELTTAKIVAKKKSYKAYLDDAFDQQMDKGLKVVNKDSLDLIHPLSLDKNKLNEMESIQAKEAYLQIFKVSPDEEEKPINKPIRTIARKEIQKNYSDFVEKKAEGTASLKVVKQI